MTTRPVYEMDKGGSFPTMHGMGEALPSEAPPPYSDSTFSHAQDHKESWQPHQQNQARPGQSINTPANAMTPYIPASGVLSGYANYNQPHGSQVLIQAELQPCPSKVKQPYHYPPPPTINYVPPPPPPRTYAMVPTPDMSHVPSNPSLSSASTTYMLSTDQSDHRRPALHRPHSQVFYSPPVEKPTQADQTMFRPHSQIFASISQPEALMIANRQQSVYTPADLSAGNYQPNMYQPQVQHHPPMQHPVPQRPPLEHLFSDPYIGPAHTAQQHPSAFQSPQYEHAVAEPSFQPPQGGLVAPALPPRPLSAPIPHELVPEIQTLNGAPSTEYAPTQLPATISQGEKDDRKSNFGHRFVGNMLFVRAARSSFQSITSTAQLPFYLSPWGDNNPITLPNVRIRDIALLGLATVGMDALAPGLVELVGPIVNHAVIMTTEQAAHEGIEGVQGTKKKKATSVIPRGDVNSMQIKIKHKLMGADALIQLLGEKEAADRVSCAKGWFCPYLYASGRSPRIARGKEFSMAQFYGPGLAADASLAPLLLTALTSIAPLHSICDTIPSSPNIPRFRRMLFCVLALAPYRTSSWSQARIPNEGRFSMHVLSSVPGFVLPVKATAPICAWSPRTVSQILEGAAFGATGMYGVQGAQGEAEDSGGYDASKHCYELLEFVDKVIDEAMIRAEDRSDWKTKAGVAAWSMIDGVRAWGALWRTGQMGKVVDVQRAGIVAFRY